MSIELCEPDKKTVCELNCRLVHVDADSAASSQGLSYPCIQVDDGNQQDAAQGQADVPVYVRGHTSHANAMNRVLSLAWQVAGHGRSPIQLLYNYLLGHQLDIVCSLKAKQFSIKLHSPTTTDIPPPIAWHPHISVLAAANSSSTAVHVFDMPRAQASNGATQPRVIHQPRCVLQHELQPRAWCFAWRPCRGSQLAVGTTGGISCWSTEGSGRPPLASRTAGGRSTGPWLLFLKSHHPHARFTAVCWSPDGRLLAAASPDVPGIAIWDVAQGTCAQVGAGLAAITLLRWSPCGSYVFGAGVGNRFHLWETGRWDHMSWDAPRTSGPVTQAAWAPNSRVLLLSFQEGSGHMLALHLVKDPPSLVAQLMPVVLPDVSLRSDADNRAGVTSLSSQTGARVVEDWSWDNTGERLVMLLQHPHPAAGCIAVYATSYEPVVHARLLGYARPPPDVLQEGSFSGCLAAHNTFTRGALFTLRGSSGEDAKRDEPSLLYNLPLYFR